MAGWRINLIFDLGFLIFDLDLRLRLRLGERLFRDNSFDLVDYYFRPKGFHVSASRRTIQSKSKNQKFQIKNQKNPALIYPNVQTL